MTYDLIKYERRDHLGYDEISYISGESPAIEKYCKDNSINDIEILYKSDDDFRFILWLDINNMNKVKGYFPRKIDPRCIFFMIVFDTGKYVIIDPSGELIGSENCSLGVECEDEYLLEANYLKSLFEHYGVRDNDNDYTEFPEFADGLTFNVCDSVYELFSDVNLDVGVDSESVLVKFSLIKKYDPEWGKFTPYYVTPDNGFENGTWNLVFITFGDMIRIPLLSPIGSTPYDATGVMYTDNPFLTRIKNNSYLAYGYEKTTGRALLDRLVGHAVSDSVDSADAMSYLLYKYPYLIQSGLLRIEKIYTTRTERQPDVYMVEVYDQDEDFIEQYVLIDTEDRVICRKHDGSEPRTDWAEIYEYIKCKDNSEFKGVNMAPPPYKYKIVKVVASSDRPQMDQIGIFAI